MTKKEVNEAYVDDIVSRLILKWVVLPNGNPSFMSILDVSCF
jgi:hypothetical protein